MHLFFPFIDEEDSLLRGAGSGGGSELVSPAGPYFFFLGLRFAFFLFDVNSFISFLFSDSFPDVINSLDRATDTIVRTNRSTRSSSEGKDLTKQLEFAHYYGKHL